MGRKKAEGEEKENREGRRDWERGRGRRSEREGRRGQRGVLSAQHPKLTCSIYCQYLKYDATQAN